MTKAELIETLREYPDEAEVVIEVHDTTLHEDLYDFKLDPISWHFTDGTSTGLQMHELRLCPIKNNQ